MSAEQLGHRLLDEVEERSFIDLLQEIRERAREHQTSHLGIEKLDLILDIFRRPVEQAARQPWTSLQAFSDDEENYHDGFETPSRLGSHGSRHKTQPKASIIQLTSSRSAAGKSSLLYSLSAISILPASHTGNEAAVVWLDTDSRFSALRLAQVASHFFPASASKVDQDQVIQEALSHIHVFKSQSAAQLSDTLKALPDYLLSQTLHRSQQRALGLIVLDSATSFYWADRADAEIARLSDPGAPHPPSTSSSVIAQLRKLEKSFNCTVLFATDATLQRKGRAKIHADIRTVADSALPPENDHDLWTSFATLTLDVHRLPVPQFAPAMTVEECARDQPRRIEAVKRGRHRAQVVWMGEESKEVIDGIRSLQNGEGFTFLVSGQGVDFE